MGHCEPPEAEWKQFFTDVLPGTPSKEQLDAIRLEERHHNAIALRVDANVRWGLDASDGAHQR